MRASDAASLLRSLDEHDLVVWVDGGWGVDALVGRETRPHGDLDLIISTADVDRFGDWVDAHGFRLVAGEPGAGLYRDQQGSSIDVGAIEFGDDGSGTYRSGKGTEVRYAAESFRGRGSIGGVEVRCLTPQAQLLAHSGYDRSPKDEHDVELLREVVGRP